MTYGGAVSSKRVQPDGKVEDIELTIKQGFKATVNMDDKETVIKNLFNFDTKIKGFNQDDTILAGIESRTSSPVRITRDDNLESINVKGLYPCGEGAGYAGGITTSAMDGLKVAEVIIKNHYY